jgi:hypothetical protein
MVSDVSQGSQSRERPTAAKGAAATRKRKGSSSAIPPRGAAKRAAWSRKRADPAEQGSGGGADPVEGGTGKTAAIQVRRCPLN